LNIPPEVYRKVIARWPNSDPEKVKVAIQMVMTDSMSGTLPEMSDFSYLCYVMTTAGFDNMYVPVWVVEETREYVYNLKLWKYLYGNEI
jgi:hypothetical protein